MKFLFRFITKLISYHSTFITFLPRYIYEDKKVQRRLVKKPAIIAINHKKPIDFVLMKHVFVLNYLHCLIGETLYNSSKALGFVLDMFGSIKVERLSNDMSFMSNSLNILNKKGIIEIYPEGHLPKDDRLQPFYHSAVYLSIMSGAEIIPVYHNGNYGLFKRVTVVIGKPIKFINASINPSLDELNEYTNILRNKILELKGIAEDKNEKN